MHPRTRATIADLEKARWFACVGRKDTESATVLSSWHEAIDYCSSAEWENLCLEATNQYCERLAEKSIDRFNKWNEVIAELKQVTVPLVCRKTSAVIEQEQLPKVFNDMVQWDILHVCMEAEYADIYSPGFYASQAYWYVRGHFPCGWEGDFPCGHLIIY